MNDTDSPAIAFRGVSKTYRSGAGGPPHRALDSISLEVGRGEFVAVMGPSGSGKTTMLNLAGLIDRPDSGEILLEGESGRALAGRELADFRRRRLGFVFQDSNLIDTMTLGENILLPLALDGAGEAGAARRVDELARSLGIAELLAKYPCETSGGQRQRAAAARALALRPSILLADEPTGALDSRAGRGLMECFESLNASSGSAILMVTHDPFAASWAGRVLFLRDGELFTELRRAGDRRAFFERIMAVVSAMEGETR
jgi:ABC-type lipoprotein export system ATPase subunit